MKFQLILTLVSFAIAKKYLHDVDITRHIGCVQDGINRILKTLLGINFGKYKCLYSCNDLGFAYAGSESGTECWCGTKLEYPPKLLDSSMCNSTCSYSSFENTSLEVCGGSWAIDVWETKPSTYDLKNTRYIGCFQDSIVRRFNSQSKLHNYDANTPANCAKYCSLNSLAYSAVENGNECYCLSTLLFEGRNVGGDLERLDESKCKVKCPASNETCGGAWAFDLRVDSAYPEIDFTLLTAPNAPSAGTISLSVIVLVCCFISITYSFYYIVKEREYIYKHATKSQQIRNVLVKSFILNLLHLMITFIVALPFSISIYSGLSLDVFALVYLYAHECREFFMSIALALTGIATIWRYENLVMGKPSTLTTICKWIMIVEMVSFVPKIIGDILFKAGCLKTRSYVTPTVTFFYVFLFYGLLD